MLKKFKDHATYGIVPEAKNYFYESVNRVEGVTSPVKRVIFGEKSDSSNDVSNRRKAKRGNVISFTYTASTIALKSLYLTFAYLSYWPAKLISEKNTESLADYSSMLLSKADKHSQKVAEFVCITLSFIYTAVIWIAASVLTPVVCAANKVESKFSDVKDPKHHQTLDDKDPILSHQ